MTDYGPPATATDAEREQYWIAFSQGWRKRLEAERGDPTPLLDWLDGFTHGARAASRPDIAKSMAVRDAA